jgi:hypothetical protein
MARISSADRLSWLKILIFWVELYLHSPSTPSWRGAQLKHSDNFTFITFLVPSDECRQYGTL